MDQESISSGSYAGWLGIQAMESHRPGFKSGSITDLGQVT